MEQRILGGTGVAVSSLGFGAMNLGAWGGLDEAASTRLVNEALDSGITLFDTADVYSSGQSEELLGKALGRRRDQVVLATKAGNPMGEGPLRRGGSRRWLTRAVEDSLRRLGTDHIDLYQLHRPDPATDLDETLAALTDLQRAGKIGSFGSSTFFAHDIVEAQWLARDRALTRFTTEQVSYSLLARAVERDVLPVARRHRMGILVWSPLANGWLAGTVRREGPVTARRAHLAQQAFDLDDPANRRKFDIIDALREIAADAGLTLVELALGFTLAHPAVSTVLIGPRTPEHLRHNLRAADVRLDAALLDRIDAVTEPGVDVAPRERWMISPEMDDPRLRRRP
ncbi:aldo/keto reductase [Streptomyces sp. NPDC006627]|uniref:aldo/keto reductase n=1 Tax=Streptomyces sp. NPDC006627 TaxID=3154679 RepID=UPI0033B6E5D0